MDEAKLGLPVGIPRVVGTRHGREVLVASAPVELGDHVHDARISGRRSAFEQQRKQTSRQLRSAEVVRSPVDLEAVIALPGRLPLREQVEVDARAVDEDVESAPGLLVVSREGIDGIGGGEKDTVYVIGRSHYPKLLELVTPHLAKEKLPLGRDIDKFAYARGSDHWPLHEAGVPAITLFGTNYRSMNTVGDTLARVDVGMLERVARALYRTVRQAAK